MSKNKVKIMIDNKPFILMGEESEEHIKQVADYINLKIKEVKEISPRIASDFRMTHVLTSINVADDFFKEKEKNAILSKQLGDTDRKKSLDETRNKQMKDLKKLLETAKIAMVDYQNKLKQQETKYQTLSHNFENTKQELQNITEEKDSLENAKKQLEEKLKQCEQALENTRQQWNKIKEKLQEAEQKQLESDVQIQYEKEIESLVLLLESEKKETKHLQQLLEESSDLEQKEFDRQKLWEEKEKKVFAMLQKVNKELEQEKLQYEKQLENLRSELEQEKQSLLKQKEHEFEYQLFDLELQLEEEQKQSEALKKQVEEQKKQIEELKVKGV